MFIPAVLRRYLLLKGEPHSVIGCLVEVLLVWDGTLSVVFGVGGYCGRMEGRMYDVIEPLSGGTWMLFFQKYALCDKTKTSSRGDL
jgi:hypothetical protein